MNRLKNKAWLAALLVSACGWEPEPEPVEWPDLVLITVDTLRADFASDQDTMPELVRFADQSVRFSNAFAAAPITTASLGSMLTGRPPRLHGALNNTDDLWPEVPTVTMELAAVGYDTAAVLPSFLADKPGFERAFDRYEFAPLGAPIWTGEQVVKRALTLLEARETDRANGARLAPLFLWVHLIDPHSPYDAGPALESAHLADLDVDHVPDRLRKESGHPKDTRTPQEAAITRALYTADVELTDAALADLLAFLSRPIRSDVAFPPPDVITVFTADHGESLGEDHGYVGHTASMRDEVLRVPLLVHRQQGTSEQRTDPAWGPDVALTLLDLANHPKLDDVVRAWQRRGDGALPLLNPEYAGRMSLWAAERANASAPWTVDDRVVVSETFAPEGFQDQRAVRWRHWKARLAQGDVLEAIFRTPDQALDAAFGATAEGAALITKATQWSDRLGAVGTAKRNPQPVSTALRDALDQLGYTGDDGGQ